MRISGGSARGITLKTIEATGFRPATDQMRQAVFSSLGDRVEGARFLDLCAGCGAYGLEALSRGAVGGDFVEKNGRLAKLVQENLIAVCKSMQCTDITCQVSARDLFAWQPASEERYDLIFIDPPYATIEDWVSSGLFERIRGWIKQSPESRLIFEMPGQMTFNPEGWETLHRLGKGRNDPSVVFFGVSGLL
jgi:16S rRNA (guanine966-N2)-methyltransferase